MRKFTHLFRSLAILALSLSAYMAKSQCTANFIYSNQANGLVSFTSTSTSNTATTTYYWTFGTSSTSATYSGTGFAGAFANYTYTTNGTYVVTLFILSSSPSCSAAVQQTITVTNGTSNPCNLGASFTRTLGANGSVAFTNNSSGTTGATTYTWDFGDGNTSNLVNPTHTYAANGSYITTLIASNNTTPACTGTVQVIAHITNVGCASLATANFTSSNGSNGSVSFVSTSTGTTASSYYSWSFGDGGTSNAMNPTHVFLNGTYNVMLSVANSSTSLGCSDTVYHVVTVSNNTCVANAIFTLVPSGTPHNYFAVPASTTNVAGAQWNWGDGSISNTLMTSHTYSAAGNYTICLSVTLTCGAAANFCFGTYLSKSSQDNNVVQIDVVAPGTSVGLAQTAALEKDLSVFPNPNKGTFNVQLKGSSDENVTIEVYNMMGQLSYTAKEQTRNGSLLKNIDLAGMQDGVYFLKVTRGGQSATTKISVQK